MSEPKPTYRHDYRPPAYRVTHVGLTFELDPAATRVKASLQLERNPEREADAPLELDGEQLILKSIASSITPSRPWKLAGQRRRCAAAERA